VGKVCRPRQSSNAQFVGFPTIDAGRMASAVIFGSELDHQIALGASAACRATGSRRRLPEAPENSICFGRTAPARPQILTTPRDSSLNSS
jgi:hypothetical protein